jgi:hypothetical protein
VKRKLRSQLAVSGALGVIGGAALIGGALFLLQRTGLEPLVTGWTTRVLLAFILVFSLAEVPTMICGMRYLAGSVSGKRLVVMINAAFTFFAAVYALPFLLLTGRVGVSIALVALSLVRFAGGMWFVPTGLSIESKP